MESQDRLLKTKNVLSQLSLDWSGVEAWRLGEAEKDRLFDELYDGVDLQAHFLCHI